MAEILEEFITLTPLTCVQQVDALLGTTAKPKSCAVFFTLFGVYCGALAYRAYRSYSSNQGGDRAMILQGIALEPKVEDLNVEEDSSLVNDIVQPTSPILLQPIDFSSTDMRWRYCSRLLEAEVKVGSESNREKDEKAKKVDILESERTSIVADDDEYEPPTVSVATSTTREKARPQGDSVDNEHVQETTFLV
ncbi:uncharacterized protein LOC108090433 [Drosophila ficusphila]|uniref:uncharacterized protein LOC108090433 n=1 Tax=Drosophila ficusphila TaxID=30025 RepID=UPI0007E60714|nr:uncharacterized protein LOC108090433 [Drosophila ficusphila]